MTLSDLRSLLTAAHGPAVERLEDRTPEGVARAYLPVDIRFVWTHEWTVASETVPAIADAADPEWGNRKRLALTDPNTVFAVRVALALALGRDPGPMGCAVAWRALRSAGRHVGWWLSCNDDAMYFVFESDATGDTDEIVSDAVAFELDAVKALVLAVRHVLGSPC